MTNAQSIAALEDRAAAQRRQLQTAVEDLRGAVKRRLDVKANARQYMAPASGIAAVLGLGLGYLAASLFFDLKPRGSRR